MDAPINRALIEAMLDNGKLYVRMGNQRLWAARRNGATKLWKTRPADYSIPVKAGLKATGRVTETSRVEWGDMTLQRGPTLRVLIIEAI